MRKLNKLITVLCDNASIYGNFNQHKILKQWGYMFHQKSVSVFPMTSQCRQLSTSAKHLHCRSYMFGSSMFSGNLSEWCNRTRVQSDFYQNKGPYSVQALRSRHTDKASGSESWTTSEELHVYRDLQTIENTGLLIKLANENGYLSWCRNTYIASMVAATTHLQTTVPYTKDVAFLFFLMAGVQLICGTGSYLYRVTSLRKKMHLSKLSVLFTYAAALGHVTVWLGAVAIYLGYVEEVESEDNAEKNDA